jgi:hypothetical protein
MYFLGTPHRGADAAQVARIVRYSAGHSGKAYLDDLVPRSNALNVGRHNPFQDFFPMCQQATTPEI